MGKVYKKSELGSLQNQSAESVWGPHSLLNQGATNNGFGSRSSSPQQRWHQNTSLSQQNHQTISNSSSNSRIHNNVGTSRRNSKSGPFGNQTFDDAWNDEYGLWKWQKSNQN